MLGYWNTFALVIVTSAVSALAQTSPVTTTTGGTSYQVPIFTGTKNVENSTISQFSYNGWIGIGLANSQHPQNQLDVNGWISTGVTDPTTNKKQIGTGGIVFPDGTYQLTAFSTDKAIQLANSVTSLSFLQSTESGSIGGQLLLTNTAKKLAKTAYQWAIMNLAEPQATGSGNTDSLVFMALDQTGVTNCSSGMCASRLTLMDNGNVGIGTTKPGADLTALPSPPASGTPVLEVAGDIALAQNTGGQVFFSDGTVQSTAWNGVLTGGDYAESVDVTGKKQDYGPGDVLVVDVTCEGRFAKSSLAYSTAVMGIYSTRPGLVGRRQRSERNHMIDEVPMAMIGVVPTKVTAEGGPIKPGDLLVTSSKPGYAMKGTDHAQMMGAIIGKSLGHLDKGDGVVEVAVSLQ